MVRDAHQVYVVLAALWVVAPHSYPCSNAGNAAPVGNRLPLMYLLNDILQHAVIKNSLLVRCSLR